MGERMRRALAVMLAVAGLAGPMGCAMDESPDAEDEVGVVPGGKADGESFTACELSSVVELLNTTATVDSLREGGVHSRAAANLIADRDGPDGLLGTEDDDLYADIEEVDAVRYVGRVAIQQLVALVAEACAAPPAGGAEVVFSPTAYASSHLTRIRELIDGAERSIDIAMYSFRDAEISAALARAVARGVTVRFLFETASTDRSSPTGGTSRALENAGIEVRWINKIMHHKLAIIDGARTSLAEADTAILVTGSGNWSNSAATRYDENTVVVRGNRELNLRYQREFNHLWDNARLFIGNETIPPVEAIAIDEADLEHDASVDAYFTSANFTAYESARYGPTFTLEPGRDEVADQWVAAIQGARRSIRIASGHLRSRPVVEALLAARAANPSLDVRVYLDNQEYLTEWTHAEQLTELAACLDAATTDAQRQGCNDRGFLFSYQVHEAGIPVRYKYYAYRWDHAYADQMHHKYMIVDEEVLVTGSYNLSDNAEHATMENIVVFRGAPHAALVEAFVDNFDAMWVTQEAEGTYAALMDQITNGTGDFPIVFTPMALDWSQVTALREAIRAECPLINSTEYRTNPAAHRYCDRD